MYPYTDLKPGDVLCYRTSGFIGWAIRVKTWSPINHVETYLGDGMTAASRDGIGVNIYEMYAPDDPKRTLIAVLRPKGPFDLDAGIRWAQSCVGQAYDAMACLAFFLSSHRGTPDKQMCSEMATRMARVMGLHPFADNFDADRVSPGMFLSSPAYTVAYRTGDDA